MLDHPTLHHLKGLRLDGMAEAFAELQMQDRAADLSHAEWLGLLVDREVASREQSGLRPACALPSYAMLAPAGRCRLPRAPRPR